jgi:glycosyltransferase involved in cell wall biosynthesis
VAGDAAIYFNPYDVNDIADTIVRFVNQHDHSDLIARLSQRLKLFSWQKTADQIVKIIQSI